MVMAKPSKSMDINPILLIFAVHVCLIHINLHAKHEGNLPGGFQDRPIATEAATKFRLRLWRDWWVYDVIDDVLARGTSRDVILWTDGTGSVYRVC